jgi:hypothetical protein
MYEDGVPRNHRIIVMGVDSVRQEKQTPIGELPSSRGYQHPVGFGSDQWWASGDN